MHPNTLLISVLLLLLTWGSTARAQATYEERKNALLDRYAQTEVEGQPALYSKYAFWYAQANFARGNTADALTLVEAALDHQISDEGQASFRYWTMIDCYLRWQDQYPQALKDKTRQQMTSFEDYGGGFTENHQLMLRTARYLVSVRELKTLVFCAMRRNFVHKWQTNVGYQI